MTVCTREFAALGRVLIRVEIGACRYPGDVLVFLIPCVIDGCVATLFSARLSGTSLVQCMGRRRDAASGLSRLNRCDGQSLAQDIW